MCTDLVAAGCYFFRYSYLYTVMIILLFLRGGRWAFFAGSFYPSNTIDRTLDTAFHARNAPFILKGIQSTLAKADTLGTRFTVRLREVSVLQRVYVT